MSVNGQRVDSLEHISGFKDDMGCSNESTNIEKYIADQQANSSGGPENLQQMYERVMGSEAGNLSGIFQ